MAESVVNHEPDAPEAQDASGALLARLAARSRERFEARRQILSFSEYMAEVLEDPRRHTRDAARYARDAFDSLLALPEGTDPRPTLRSLPRQLDVDVDDPAVLEDLDDPEQLASLG